MNSIGKQVESSRRSCGATANSAQARWRVWAPAAEHVELVLIDADRKRIRSMESEAGGYFRHVENSTRDGQRYAFCLAGGVELPDPASLFQPDGVHGPSAVVDTGAFQWTDRRWTGIPWKEIVFYELHVGTFTPQGTFEAIIERLPELKRLGVTAIELMPVAQFPGTRNWGYDGVHPYAAQNSYGGPRGLQRLVNACHEVGLAIFLDVVYNHLGPEGNYLAQFGPYFTDRYKTGWGAALNYDGPQSDPVRDYVLDNVRMWLEEFHFDGLRLDAVHAIYDLGARHILRDIQTAADRVSRRTGRSAYIIAESDQNDPRLLYPVEKGGYGLQGVWSDDFHHCVHVCLTGEAQGYYQDYPGPHNLATVLERPFLYAGQYSQCRKRKHGTDPSGLSGDRFIVCIQNHDQVGNRAQGDRFGTLLTTAQRKLAASLLLLSPHLPLIFMGEEYAEENPFPFFCSFTDPSLRKAVREGRMAEFASFAWQGAVLDPGDEATFLRARLSWSWPEQSERAFLRRMYQDLLYARRNCPALKDFDRRSARLISTEGRSAVLELVRGSADTGHLQIFFNLGDAVWQLPVMRATVKCLFRSESARYGGTGSAEESVDYIQAYECVVLGPSAWESFRYPTVEAEPGPDALGMGS